jgi:hypothetical protein
MNRREFLAAGVGGALGTSVLGAEEGRKPTATRQGGLRAAFPRLESDVFLDAAGGTPLGTFAEEGLRRYVAFQQLGPGEGRGDHVAEMQANVRGLFGKLIGARASEIALVHCTKAGEQIVLDGLDPRGRGRNVVTNDMHFSGSLHNLVGYRRAGADVRIVRASIPTASSASRRRSIGPQSLHSWRRSRAGCWTSSEPRMSWSRWRATACACLPVCITTLGTSMPWRTC